MCWESQPSSPPVLRLGGLRLRVKQPMRSPLRIESGVTIKGNAGFTLKRMCHFRTRRISRTPLVPWMRYLDAVVPGYHGDSQSAFLGSITLRHLGGSEHPKQEHAFMVWVLAMVQIVVQRISTARACCDDRGLCGPVSMAEVLWIYVSMNLQLWSLEERLSCSSLPSIVPTSLVEEVHMRQEFEDGHSTLPKNHVNISHLLAPVDKLVILRASMKEFPASPQPKLADRISKGYQTSRSSCPSRASSTECRAGSKADICAACVSTVPESALRFQELRK
ncbi:hypothetical protein V8E53_015046 [Lactarius tabidus]